MNSLVPFWNQCSNLLNMTATYTFWNLFSSGLFQSLIISFKEVWQSMTLRIWGVQVYNSSMTILTPRSKTKLYKSLFSLKTKSKQRLHQMSLKRPILSTKALQIKTSASTRSLNLSRTWRYWTKLWDKRSLKHSIQTLRRDWWWLSNLLRIFNYTTSNQRS